MVAVEVVAIENYSGEEFLGSCIVSVGLHRLSHSRNLQLFGFKLLLFSGSATLALDYYTFPHVDPVTQTR